MLITNCNSSLHPLRNIYYSNNTPNLRDKSPSAAIKYLIPYPGKCFSPPHTATSDAVKFIQLQCFISVYKVGVVVTPDSTKWSPFSIIIHYIKQAHYVVYYECVKYIVALNYTQYCHVCVIYLWMSNLLLFHGYYT